MGFPGWKSKAGGDNGPPPSSSSFSRKVFELAGTVTQPVHMNIHAVQHAQEQIRQRRFPPVNNVPPRFQRAAALAGDEDGQVVVVVPVAVAVAAAVDEHALVEQRAVAFANGLQLGQEIRELRDMEL